MHAKEHHSGAEWGLISFLSLALRESEFKSWGRWEEKNKIKMSFFNFFSNNLRLQKIELKLEVGG